MNLRWDRTRKITSIRFRSVSKKRESKQIVNHARYSGACFSCVCSYRCTPVGSEIDVHHSYGRVYFLIYSSYPISLDLREVFVSGRVIFASTCERITEIILFFVLIQVLSYSSMHEYLHDEILVIVSRTNLIFVELRYWLKKRQKWTNLSIVSLYDKSYTRSRIFFFFPFFWYNIEIWNEFQRIDVFPFSIVRYQRNTLIFVTEKISEKKMISIKFSKAIQRSSFESVFDDLNSCLWRNWFWDATVIYRQERLLMKSNLIESWRSLN